MLHRSGVLFPVVIDLNQTTPEFVLHFIYFFHGEQIGPITPTRCCACCCKTTLITVVSSKQGHVVMSQTGFRIRRNVGKQVKEKNKLSLPRLQRTSIPAQWSWSVFKGFDFFTSFLAAFLHFSFSLQTSRAGSQVLINELQRCWWAHMAQLNTDMFPTCHSNTSTWIK